jgi:hypothetical protein
MFSNLGHEPKMALGANNQFQLSDGRMIVFQRIWTMATAANIEAATSAIIAPLPESYSAER